MDTINTCLATTAQYHTLAYYSHLVPIFLGLLLSIFALVKTKGSKLSIIFFTFVFSFSIWLVSDLIQWVVPNYHWIYFLWSWTDYANLVFFAMGVYFFGVLARKKISLVEKILLVLILLPLFALAVTAHTVVGLDQAQCNAINNSFDVTYTNYADIAYCALLVVSFLLAWFKDKISGIKRVQAITVGLSMLAFFLTFGITNYIAAQVAQYQINLYGLFVLPLFLIIMAFTISNLGLFQLRFLGTQLLVYVLMIIVGSQFFFVEGIANQTLTGAIFVITIGLSYLLLKNTGSEIKARTQIEKLAGELEESNKGQENLIHVMNHQIKGYLAKDRNVFSELLADGEYGTLNDAGKEMIELGFESATKGIDFVQDILKGSSAQKGTLPYNMQMIDFKKVVTEVVAGQRKSAEDKGLTFEFTTGAGDYAMMGDPTHLGEAVRNLIDNSINYTQKGSISMSLNRAADKIVFTVKDSGVGINAEDKTKLFTQGGRGRESSKINVNSTGYGLVFVKSVAVAHHGSVRADSLGTGKGSTFTLELPAGK